MHRVTNLKTYTTRTTSLLLANNYHYKITTVHLIRDEIATRKRAIAAADAEIQRLVDVEVAARMPEVEAEVQKRLDVALAAMMLEVEAKVAKERDTLLEALATTNAETAKLVDDAKAAQHVEQQRLDRERLERLAGEQRVRAEKRNADERLRAEEQTKILNRSVGGSKSNKKSARPKLKFGLGGASLL